MGLVSFLKYAVNNTIGTDYFYPLDELLSATLVLRGTTGTTFTVKNTEGLYEDFTIELTEDSDVFEGLEYIHLVPVALGTYTVTVSVEDYTTDVTVVVDQLGQKYLVEYLFTVAELTANGDVLIPDNLDAVFVTACGGGGGGSSGLDGASTTTPGGSGGGGGDYIIDQKFTVTPSSTLTCTVGAGGAGGAGVASGAKAGKAGGSTVIGNLVTLSGGGGGKVPAAGSAGAAGAGSGNGGSGGKGSTNSADGAKGANGKLSGGGTGGAGGTGTFGGQGGGGGGSLGNGSDGCGETLYNTLTSSSVALPAGTKGGGGGGGKGGDFSSSIVYRHKGAAGGKGYIKIMRGVKAV